VWACGWGQTHRQTRMTNIHLVSSTTHSKCNYSQANNSSATAWMIESDAARADNFPKSDTPPPRKVLPSRGQNQTQSNTEQLSSVVTSHQKPTWSIHSFSHHTPTSHTNPHREMHKQPEDKLNNYHSWLKTITYCWLKTITYCYCYFFCLTRIVSIATLGYARSLKGEALGLCSKNFYRLDALPGTRSLSTHWWS